MKSIGANVILKKWEKKRKYKLEDCGEIFYHSILALEKRMSELDLTSFIGLWRLRNFEKRIFAL